MSEFYYMLKYFYCFVKCQIFKSHTIIDWFQDGNWTERYGECIVCKERQLK